MAMENAPFVDVFPIENCDVPPSVSFREGYQLIPDTVTGWFVERTHSARLKLNVSCGTMSFLIAGTQDGPSGKPTCDILWLVNLPPPPNVPSPKKWGLIKGSLTIVCP